MSDLKLLATILYRMPEPRRTNKGNIRHKLVDIIVITLCARLSIVAIVLMPWSTSDMNAKNI